jgi:hypothetical protein
MPEMDKLRAAKTLEAFSQSYKQTKLSGLDGPFSKLAEEFPKLRLRYIRANEVQFVTK